MPRVVALAVLVVLAGCATAAQRQYQAITATAQSAQQEMAVCLQAVYSSPEYDPLRKHIPLDVRTATLEQLTDTNFATDAEIKAVLVLHPRTQECRTAFFNKVANVVPTMVPLYTEVMTKSEDSLIDLVQRKQSWGDHIRRVRDISAATQAKITAEAQRITSGLNQEHQAELAQRQAALNALVQYYATSQMVTAMANQQPAYQPQFITQPQAPAVPAEGPQPFRPNPTLGMQAPPPNYFQQQRPATGGVNIMNLNNGNMTSCRMNGTVISCF